MSERSSVEFRGRGLYLGPTCTREDADLHCSPEFLLLLGLLVLVSCCACPAGPDDEEDKGEDDVHYEENEGVRVVMVELTPNHDHNGHHKIWSKTWYYFHWEKILLVKVFSEQKYGIWNTAFRKCFRLKPDQIWSMDIFTCFNSGATPLFSTLPHSSAGTPGCSSKINKINI